MDRKPAVAGSFYPADPEALRREVGACLGPAREAAPALAVLVPHAGYIYSGPCAGRTYSEVRIPRLAALLGPNHTGMGAELALMEDGRWEMPLGPATIDLSLARRLRELDPDLCHDPRAHLREHALEVQLPFLQVLRPDLRFVPICVGTRRLRDLMALGKAVAEAIREAGEEVLVVISSDMSHYIPFERARQRDALAIQMMERIDPEGLYQVVEREGITMCGYRPAVAGIEAARELGATRGRLVDYTSSGDRSGDYDDVVSYAGLIFD